MHPSPLLDDGTNRIFAGCGEMGKVDEHLYDSSGETIKGQNRV
jgi:hypothetical protein